MNSNCKWNDIPKTLAKRNIANTSATTAQFLQVLRKGLSRMINRKLLLGFDRWIAAFAPRDDHVESVERTRGMCMYPFRRHADCFIPVSKLFRQYFWEGNTRIDPRCIPD